MSTPLRPARARTTHAPPALALALALWLALSPGAAAAAPLPDPPTLRSWIQEMKASPKGPFYLVRWFCADGTVHPAKPYPCGERGGGIQHGEWNQRVKDMRAGGYAIGNVLAELEPDDFTGPAPQLDTLSQILLERFLIEWDDGWIFRGARSYRGALQIEDEEAGARAVVLAMLADPAWRAPSRFLLLREAVRLLPLQADETTAAKVRTLALVIAEKDEDFTPLRAKIHNAPDAEDAAKVRDYAATRGRPELAGDYAELADAIDTLYTANEAGAAARALAPRVADAELSGYLRDVSPRIASPSDPGERLAAASRLLAQIREGFGEVRDPDVALELLQTSLLLEDVVYTAGGRLRVNLASTTRRQRLAWILQLGRALYGSGLISRRSVDGVSDSLNRFARASTVPLGQYREELRYLARVPEWAARQMAFHFGEAVTLFEPIEPLAHLYEQDRLRGSPLLFYGAVIDSLVLDANQLAGIEHEIFGRRVGAGLRALNPGLTRGVLRSAGPEVAPSSIRPDGVYLLPETVSDLPAIAGILTRGEGSSLSHVQLLARNLGIPNVVVGNALLPVVESHLGQKVVLAVSPGGVVQLANDGPRWDAVFGAEESGSGVVIRPDLEKLDLDKRDFVPLSELRATDSGRVSGPKGANLGELKHYFGDAVPNGFVIPFGAFRHMLDRPLEPGGPPVFEWMKERYAAIEALDGRPAEQERVVSQFLARLRRWIETTDPGPEFRRKLRDQLRKSFGPGENYGVFVRSDTNVEDLPGFTGAGLNLTLFNVVGFENIVEAIGRVWASPFTERAYGWRQAHMEQPEYVFPAVVIQYSFPSQKSGVMVTADVEGGQPDWVSIAVSEGVGGAVEGQAAESLRVNTRTGEVRVLAEATAPRRSVLSPSGGIDHPRASGAEAVLTPAEIGVLSRFAREVPFRFPSLRDAAGNPLPADVEFAFRNGKLALLQIRPFVENKRAQRSQYLSRLDAGLRSASGGVVPLDAVPGTGGPQQ